MAFSGAGSCSPPPPAGPAPKGPAPAPAAAVPASPKTPSGLNRLRYAEVTAQVRRMPFGLVVIVDQMHVNDVLTALTNYTLDVQITQTHWQHYRGNLAAAARPGGKPEEGQGSFVELAVYGYIKLYERHASDAPPAAGTPPAAPVKP